MAGFDDSAFSADELWNYCRTNYASRNPLITRLMDNFYRHVEKGLARLGPEDRVLEVGCGAGESTLRIHRMLGQRPFEASEFDQRYVDKLLATRFPVKVRQESVYSLQRPDKSFDCVVMLEVLEHLEDYELALSELFRVAKGYVLISVPNEPLWRALNMVRGKYLPQLGNTPGHINHWSRRGLRRLLSAHGTVETIYSPVPWSIAVVKVGGNS